jgi:hypothetical protein
MGAFSSSSFHWCIGVDHFIFNPTSRCSCPEVFWDKGERTMFGMLLEGFGAVFTDPLSIIMIFIGTRVGIVFGALPGLTTVAGLSMFLPSPMQ